MTLNPIASLILNSNCARPNYAANSKFSNSNNINSSKSRSVISRTELLSLSINSNVIAADWAVQACPYSEDLLAGCS